jgi:hypothetical protein
VARTLPWIALLATVAVAVAPAASAAQDARAVVCPAIDAAPRDLAARVESLGAPGRDALLALATSAPADSRCGLAGLAAVRDARVVPLLAGAIAAAPADPEVWRLVRWAAFVAGGPDAALAAPFVPLLAALDTPAARAASGDDRLRLLGELDHAEARDRLVAALDEPMSEGAIDAAIHALARQREPRARARVAALGAEMANGLATNATYEQARRLGAVSFYLLVLAPDTEREGIAHLARLSPGDQADTVAWAAQTLCEHGVRRPDAHAASEALRAAVVSAAATAGIAWQGLARGTFVCPAP